METSPRRIRRRCLIVGAATLALFVWYEVFVVIRDQLFGFRALLAACCLGGLVGSWLSVRQFRELRASDDSGDLLKRAEQDCQLALSNLLLLAVWLLLGMPFFNSSFDISPILVGVSGILSLRTAWRLHKVL